MTDDINLLMNIARTIIIAAVSLKVILAFLKCQTGSSPLAAAIEKAKKVIGAGIIASVLPSFLPFLASNYFNPGKVSTITQASDGVIALINSFVKVIITLEPGVVTFFVMKELTQRNIETEDYAKSECIKRAKTIGTLGIIIITCTEIVNVILGYYA